MMKTDHYPESPSFVGFEVASLDGGEREGDVGEGDGASEVEEGEVAEEGGEQAGRHVADEIYKATRLRMEDIP